MAEKKILEFSWDVISQFLEKSQNWKNGQLIVLYSIDSAFFIFHAEISFHRFHEMCSTSICLNGFFQVLLYKP